MTAVAVTVNGARLVTDIEPRESLADFLRERCRLTATHLGCEQGACGACTVLVDGKVTRSCLRLAIMCDGKSVQTLEGFADDRIMEVLRRHFHACHALQCGFCTPGMLVTARDILLRLPTPDAQAVNVTVGSTSVSMLIDSGCNTMAISPAFAEQLIAQAQTLLAAEEHERRRRVVFIIDEAHLLHPTSSRSCGC